MGGNRRRGRTKSEEILKKYECVRLVLKSSGWNRMEEGSGKCKNKPKYLRNGRRAPNIPHGIYGNYYFVKKALVYKSEKLLIFLYKKYYRY